MAFSFSFDIKDGSVQPQQPAVVEINADEEDIVAIPPSVVSDDIVETSKAAVVETEASEFPALRRRCQQNVIAALKGDATVEASLLEAISLESDVLDRRYEGGLKTWECAVDLCKYLQATAHTFHAGISVLELGCGHALPSIFMAKSVRLGNLTLQDYNLAVIRHVTIPNLAANGVSIDGTVKFIHGDWRGLGTVLGRGGKFDVILASETIYRPESYGLMADIIAGSLKGEGGRALIAAKDYYFGLEGTVGQFVGFVNSRHAQYHLEARIVHRTNEHVARSIVQIERK